MLSVTCATHGQIPSSSTDQSKVVEIARVTTPPRLDGVLDDEAWLMATSINDMHQYFPLDHVPATEETEILLSYDKDFLYIGARLLDSEPDQITARVMAQGESIQFDDAFAIILDTFNNKRTGYQFAVNPNGVRDDGVFETPTELNRDWEGVWFAEATINDEGWLAEFAIPFRTLNFNEDNTNWGFTVERKIARTQEEIAWVSHNLQVNPGTSGLITGLSGMNQGRGIDIVPSLIVSENRDFNNGTTNSDIDPALDVFYKFTPSLTGVLTLNTDFSATEVDDRQINLTRFSQFFPEKRGFFLQDVDIFSFGGLNRNGIPFFSRPIGLSNKGQPVDLNVGAKLTGRVGRWNIGVLNVHQEEFQGVDASNLFVGRVSANVLEESSVGLIATDGDPRSNLDNSLVGFDFRYRNTRLPSGRTLQGEFWYQQSHTEGIDNDDEAFGFQLSSPNEIGLQGRISYMRIEENFNPGLGFVNRSDIEKSEAQFAFVRRLEDHRFIRSIKNSGFITQFNQIDGGLQSRLIFLQPLEIETNSGNSGAVQLKRQREVLVNDFEISDGVIIPPGDYEFESYSIEFKGARQRAFAPFFDWSGGDFYNGDRLKLLAGLDWRPNSRVNLGLSYEYNDIVLPTGDFTTRLIQINANYSINARWSWINLIQYDNVSESAGIYSRLRWNPRAGQNLFIVLNQTLDATGVFSGLKSDSLAFSVKYTHTLRL
jgi:hypothetical protein